MRLTLERLKQIAKQVGTGDLDITEAEYGELMHTPLTGKETKKKRLTRAIRMSLLPIRTDLYFTGYSSADYLLADIIAQGIAKEGMTPIVAMSYDTPVRLWKIWVPTSQEQAYKKWRKGGE